MSNRLLLISLAVMLVLSVSLIGCGGEEAPEVIEYNLTISSTEGGSVTSPGEDMFTYHDESVIHLAAVAGEGYHFVNWTGNVSTIADVEDATTTITMDGDYTVVAEFAPEQCSLAISSAEGGSVTTPGEATATYDYGTVVDLVAAADEGYQFLNWTGDVATIASVNASSTTVVMNGNYAITANFAKGIRDWYDLDAIRDNLRGSYVLMNDLDSTSAGYAELASAVANQGKGWEPIGTFAPHLSEYSQVARAFTGIFDGRGCELRDLSISRGDQDYVGLFGGLGQGGAVKSLAVVNAKVIGRQFVGSLVGDNAGGTVSDSYATSHVTADWDAGGLVGHSNGGTVTNSYSISIVLGYHVVGGLLGCNEWGTISECYSIANVTAEGGIGGLVGWSWGTVSNSHYDYDNTLINGERQITIGALFDQDFERWLSNGRFLDVNERLTQEHGYYLVNNVSDFEELLAFGQDADLRFKLKSDLDLGGRPNFYIPYLAGRLDGDGHRILNCSLNFESVSQVGLFGSLASGGEVTSLGVDNLNTAGELDCVGGIVGWNDGAVTDCHCTGSVNGRREIGGLVGHNHVGTVRNSYFSGSLAGQESVGGLVGWQDYGAVYNSHYNYDEVLINGNNIITIGALFDEDFEEWLTNAKFLDVNERLVREDSHYVVGDVSDLKELLAFGQDSTLKFRLTADLDLAGEPNFHIPYLAGEFDGNGHRISNLSFYFGFVSQVGLFGYLGSGGRVTRVCVENVDMTGCGAVGGLVGRNWQATVSNSCATGNVAGSFYVGGLIGYDVWGSVSNSCFGGSVTGGSNIGGLVGWNWGGTLSDSCAAGSASGFMVGGLVGYNREGTVSNAYATSSVTGFVVGGLVGQNDWEGTVSNCFWDSQASEQSTSDGGTGKTTAEMKNVTTFSGAGWNMVAVANPSTRNLAYIWNIVDGQTYPFLSWQP